MLLERNNIPSVWCNWSKTVRHFPKLKTDIDLGKEHIYDWTDVLSSDEWRFCFKTPNPYLYRTSGTTCWALRAISIVEYHGRGSIYPLSDWHYACRIQIRQYVFSMGTILQLILKFWIPVKDFKCTLKMQWNWSCYALELEVWDSIVHCFVPLLLLRFSFSCWYPKLPILEYIRI